MPRFFLDTNVFVYTFDPREPEKQVRARELVREALAERTGVISSQVCQEFLNVATRKFLRPLSHVDARAYLEGVLNPLCEVYVSGDLFHRALSLGERFKYSFYDSLILAAALEAKVGTLYSEDLQHGQRIEGLTIVDPFR